MELSLKANDGKPVTVYHGGCPLWFLVLSGALAAQNGPFMAGLPNRTHLGVTFVECYQVSNTQEQLHFQSCFHGSCWFVVIRPLGASPEEEGRDGEVLT